MCLPNVKNFSYNRSTLVEIFHTLLQGAYKYMLCQFMDSRNTSGKILAKISAFLHVVFQIEYVTTYVILCKKEFQSMDANGIVHCPCCLTDSETVLIPSL